MNFFNHPLVDIIAHHKVMNNGALFPLSGMPSSNYKEEFKKLLNEGHIKEEWDELYPRSLKIIQRDKKSQRFIKTMPVNYISRAELADIIFYDETDVAFIDGALLGEEQRAYLEGNNDIKFDFERSEYNLLVEYYSLEPVQRWLLPDTKIPVVHVDQYSLFASGLEGHLKTHFLQDFDWNYFSHSCNALDFIAGEFNANHYIHFIITDITLPGLNGVEFAKEVSRLEDEFNYRHTPIIALTMHGEDSPVMVKAKEENIFAAHFTKDVDPDVLANYVNTILL